MNVYLILIAQHVKVEIIEVLLNKKATRIGKKMQQEMAEASAIKQFSVSRCLHRIKIE